MIAMSHWMKNSTTRKNKKTVWGSRNPELASLITNNHYSISRMTDIEDSVRLIFADERFENIKTRSQALVIRIRRAKSKKKRKKRKKFLLKAQNKRRK
jgi:hypothetical protein